MSTQVPLTVTANAPQLFTLDGKNVLGAHANGTSLGKAGLLPSAPNATAPAAPGETVFIYGTGCGPTNPALIPGLVPTEAASLVRLPVVTIGGAGATVISAGILPGVAGVYQIAVQVPANTPDGDQQVVVQVGTANSAATLMTVQK
jgi:uncharacterized protein (TIGR03437 family)